MDSQTDHQKMISMKEMIAQKSRKNQRDKIIEKSRNSNPFAESKKFIQQSNSQKSQIQASDFNGVQISDEVLAKIQQFDQEMPLQQEEIDHFQKLTLNSFYFRLTKINQNNINSKENIDLLENIPEFFKESNNLLVTLVLIFQVILNMLLFQNRQEKFRCFDYKIQGRWSTRNITQLYQKLTYIESDYLLISKNKFIFGKINLFIAYKRPELLKLFLYLLKQKNSQIIFGLITKLQIYFQISVQKTRINKCLNKQEKYKIFMRIWIFIQFLQNQLFQLLGFLCSDSGIERRDYLRNTPLISYLCKQIDRYQMKQTYFASLLVRNGIWLLVSLCSDLPAEGNKDYCKDALPIFVHFLKCNNGTVGQECTWVLDTLIQYYISAENPNQQENINYFIQLELPMNLTETFKQIIFGNHILKIKQYFIIKRFSCLTTTQSAIKILKQFFFNCKTVEQKLLVANEKIITRVLELLKVQQRILVYKVIFEFIQDLICDPQLIQVLLKCDVFTYVFNAIKNPDIKYNTIGIKCLQYIVSKAQDQQIIDIVEQGLFTHLKEFLNQNQEEMISCIYALDIIEIILEAGDAIFQGQNFQENKFKLKMEQSGLIQNLDNFQLSTKEAVSQKAVQIIERFCLQKVEGIEEEIN